MMVMIGMDTADFCPMGLTTGTGTDVAPLELSSAYLAKLEYCLAGLLPIQGSAKIGDSQRRETCSINCTVIFILRQHIMIYFERLLMPRLAKSSIPFHSIQ